MLELWDHSLTYVLAFLVADRLVSSQCIENCHPTPLRTFVQSNEQFIQYTAGNDEDVLSRARSYGSIVDIGQSGNCVGDHLRYGVSA